MPGVSVRGGEPSHLQPSPLWGGQGGGADSALAGNADKSFPSAAAAAGPGPSSPTRGEGKKDGLRRLSLPIGVTQRARRLRRNMTAVERRLWAALRTTFPDAHWRKQVPLGPYFTDFCSHGAKLIVECDGGQHAEAGDHDAARTRFLEAEGYRVIRFWNNEVLENVDGVLQASAATLSSPLVGEDRGGGRDASASQETRAVASPFPMGDGA